jgi:hypothetical protein
LQDYEDADDEQQTPAKLRTALTLRFNSGMLQGSLATGATDGDAVEPASVTKQSMVRCFVLPASVTVGGALTLSMPLHACTRMRWG